MKEANINPRRSRFRRVLILLTIIASFSLIFCLFIVYHLFFSDLFQKSETLIVPDLTGVVLEEILPSELTGFQIVRIARHDDAPEGTVLSQVPEAGSRRKNVKGKRYATLTLYVSKGQELTRIPHLIGKDIQNSACELLSRGFSYLYEECFDDAPKGTVIAQSVPGGTLFQKGGSIKLTVSLGKENPKPRVPSLSGYTLVQAKSLIEASGLRIGSITYHPTSKDDGRVISQFPLPGMSVTEGTEITLTVARCVPITPQNHDGEHIESKNTGDSTSENESKGKTIAPKTNPESNELEDLLDRLFKRFDNQ